MAREAKCGAMCGSFSLYQSYSIFSRTSGESLVPSTKCLSASYVSCSSAYIDPATWCSSGSPAGKSPNLLVHLQRESQ